MLFTDEKKDFISGWYLLQKNGISKWVDLYDLNIKSMKTAENNILNNKKCDDWCEKMIDTYGFEKMTTFPYSKNFGVDGPDGKPLWGSAAEKEWKKRFP